MKELKNKVDSIRRTLKAQNIVVSAPEIESKILELCPDFPDDWCDDIRKMVIKALSKQSSELAVTEEISNLSIIATEDDDDVNTVYNDVNSLDDQDTGGSVSDAPQRPYGAGTSSLDTSSIALADKSELVSTTANDMGITLSIEEVTAIAENFDHASQDSDYEISQIESAITAFVHHKAQITKQKISNMVQGVRETVHRLDDENSQLLNDGLRDINNDIKSGSQRFKSQVSTALKCFALPSSKAG